MLDVAIDAAKQAGNLALSYFKSHPASWRVSYKKDLTPVTRADIEAEKLIRKIISKKFPSHGIVGEELETVNARAKYQWAIDPIDGTKSFIRGMPSWGTLLAVLENGRPIIGVYNSPASDEIFWAQRGKGAFLNGKKIHVSKVKNLNHAFLSYGAIYHFAEKNKLDQIVELSKVVEGRRGSSDCDSYNLLFKGQIDIYINAHCDLHDIAGPSIIAEEAGGKFTNFVGQFSLTSDQAVFTNGVLHDQVLKILK